MRIRENAIGIAGCAYAPYDNGVVIDQRSAGNEIERHGVCIYSRLSYLHDIIKNPRLGFREGIQTRCINTI